MINSETFKTLKSDLALNTFSYPKVKFPAEYKGDSVVEFIKSDDGTPISLVVNKLGAGYLSERIPGSKYGDFTAAWSSKDAIRQAQLIAQVNAVLGGNGKDYTLAVVNDEVVGVMTMYTPVSHDSVITEIEAHSFGSLVNYSKITMQEMVLNLVVRAIKDTKFIDEDSNNDPKVYASLRIRNGHSGHSALSYHAYIAAGAYEYESRLLSGSRRHLSKVASTFKNIQEALNTVEDVRLVYRLFDLDAVKAVEIMKEAVKEMSPRQEKLMALIDSTVVSGLDILAIFGEYSIIRGYLSAVKGLMDPVINYVLDLPEDALTVVIPVVVPTEDVPMGIEEIKELDGKIEVTKDAIDLMINLGVTETVDIQETPDLPGELVEDVGDVDLLNDYLDESKPETSI